MFPGAGQGPDNAEPAGLAERVEDVLLIAGIAPLWLPLLGFTGAWVWALLAADTIAMGAITVRRLSRLARLAAEKETLPPLHPPQGSVK